MCKCTWDSVSLSVPFPQLQVQSRPKRHKYGEKNRGWIIDETGEFRETAGIVQVPVVAVRVALGTHGDVLRADVVGERVRAGGGPRVKEAKEADDGRRYQHVAVEAEPREVQRELDTEVIFDFVQRLELDPLGDGGPLVEEEFPFATGVVQMTLSIFCNNVT